VQIDDTEFACLKAIVFFDPSKYQELQEQLWMHAYLQEHITDIYLFTTELQFIWNLWVILLTPSFSWI
jgi:hypothetical protein